VALPKIVVSLIDGVELKLFDRLRERRFYSGHGNDSTLGAQDRPTRSGAPVAGELPT
jgi:hypothetical protein